MECDSPAAQRNPGSGQPVVQQDLLRQQQQQAQVRHVWSSSDLERSGNPHPALHRHNSHPNEKSPNKAMNPIVAPEAIAAEPQTLIIGAPITNLHLGQGVVPNLDSNAQTTLATQLPGYSHFTAVPGQLYNTSEPVFPYIATTQGTTIVTSESSTVIPSQPHRTSNEHTDDSPMVGVCVQQSPVASH